VSLKTELTKQERKELKRQRKLEKSLSKQQQVLSELKGSVMTVLCVRFGNKYGRHYVERLRNMVDKHTTVPFEFVCLTDDPTPIQGVRLILERNAGYAKGWWHKVHMFDPKIPLKGRILYMDLDVVICGNIDKLFTVYPDQFVGIRDFNRKFHPQWKRLNSSVMAWHHGTQRHIWDQFQTSPGTAMRMHGDQDWIWKTSHDKLKFFPDEWIQSYKWEIRNRDDLHVSGGKRKFKEIKHGIKPHSECCIAVFHGDPNPSEVQDDFVTNNWR